MKRALVFGGGGSRGIYQIGAWRAAKEAGFEPDAAYGTSIGAMNAAFAASDDLETAEKIWRGNDLSRLFRTRDDKELAISRMVSRKRDILPFLLENSGSLNIDLTPLEKLLRASLREAKIRIAGRDFGCTATRVPDLSHRRVWFSDMKPGQLVDWVLASAAAFPVFPLREIDGVSYLDGGFTDNLPVGMAAQKGYDEIVCLDVHPSPANADTGLLPCVTMIHPTREVGGFLDFDEASLGRMYILGLCDGRKAFGKCEGIAYTFEREPLLPRVPVARAFASRLLREDDAADREERRMSAYIRSERPAHELTVNEMYLRGLEAAMASVGMRRDAVYRADDVLGRLRAYACAGDKLPPAGVRNAIASGEGLRAFYAAIDADGRIPRELLPLVEEDPASAAGALFLKCAAAYGR